MKSRELGPIAIFGEYVARPIEWSEYRSVSDSYGALVFPLDTAGYVPANPHPSGYRLCLGIFHGEQLVGWQYSHAQESVILMRDTGLLPAHQGLGVYSALLPRLLIHFTSSGYSEVRSRHQFQNSAAIVPKLKAGFVIVGTEVEAGVSYVKLAWSASKAPSTPAQNKVGSRSNPSDNLWTSKPR